MKISDIKDDSIIVITGQSHQSTYDQYSLLIDGEMWGYMYDYNMTVMYPYNYYGQGYNEYSLPFIVEMNIMEPKKTVDKFRKLLLLK